MPARSCGRRRTLLAWSTRDATDAIRSIARSGDLALSYSLHARNRLLERGLVISDVLYALRNGFVRRPAEPTTIPGQDCYRMESRTPNSGARSIGVVVIPEQVAAKLTIVTVMWLDEFETRAGSIIGE
ncbi:DUF4258 domain-containing protein [Jiella endophytica]|uniref:DUF4258 domain-containing protein n=1 Tax=Jiella endophytica TaxID=2558362 RepID=A0A4Y8RBC9_9HYPH|nr:DUF4258 domain-containing protein [Jiella endophytica]TFF19123.1 DUF4258 domain-containing protein [Jiella endophytica]